MKDINVRLRRLHIFEKDLHEQFVRSGGKGGQNVNKVSTCVILTHRPSGISVRCDTERSQAKNRLVARKRLLEKIENKIRHAKARVRSAREKQRRKNRKRSRASKERMLEQKRRRSQILKTRQSVPYQNE